MDKMVVCWPTGAPRPLRVGEGAVHFVAAHKWESTTMDGRTIAHSDPDHWYVAGVSRKTKPGMVRHIPREVAGLIEENVAKRKVLMDEYEQLLKRAMVTGEPLSQDEGNPEYPKRR